MKAFQKFLTVILATLFIFALSACSAGASPDDGNQNNGSNYPNNSGNQVGGDADSNTAGGNTSHGDSTVLVAYFSCTGTTQRIAEYVKTAVNGAIYKIEPLVPYTEAD